MSLTTVGNDVPRIYGKDTGSPVILIEGQYGSKEADQYLLDSPINGGEKEINLAGWFWNGLKGEHFWLNLGNNCWIKQIDNELEVAVQGIPAYVTPTPGWITVTLNDSGSTVDVWVNGIKEDTLPYSIPGTATASMTSGSESEQYADTYLAPGAPGLDIPFYRNRTALDADIQSEHTLWLNELAQIDDTPAHDPYKHPLINEGAEALYLMELERRNLLLYSEDLTQGVWNVNTTVSYDPAAQSSAVTGTPRGSVTQHVLPGDIGSRTFTLAFEVRGVSGYGNTNELFVALRAGNHSEGVAENVVLTNEWQTVTRTHTFSASPTDQRVMPYLNINEDNLVYEVRRVRLCEGSTALPYVPTSNKRAVYDYSVNGNHAHLGSSGVAFINPVGEKALNLPGENGNYASTPDSAAASVIGDIDIRVRCARPDWGTSTTTALISKANAVAQRAYMLYMTTGRLYLAHSVDGGAGLENVQSTAAVSFAGGATGWVRVTRIATTGVVRFYESTDGETWVQLGSDVSSLTGALPNTTSDLRLGDYNNGTWNGPFTAYRAQVYDGIGGTLVADFNPEDAHGDVTQFYSSTTGELWTINQSAATTNDPTWTGEGLDFDGVDDTLGGLAPGAYKIAVENGLIDLEATDYETPGIWIYPFDGVLDLLAYYDRTLSSYELWRNATAAAHILSRRGTVLAMNQEWVEAVPDATFRAALESEGITTLELLGAATSIDLTAYDLTGADWGGIEYATSVTNLDLNNTSVTGNLSAASGLTNLTGLILYNTSVSGATSPTVSTQDSLADIRLNDMALDQAAVDTVLADLVTSLSLPGRVTASVQIQNNAAPSTPDDVNTLVSAGWTVTTD